jgi:hypothetical protein
MHETKHQLTGGCHCGNITYRLSTHRKEEELPLRSCGCAFCRRIGARYTSDPAAELQIEIMDPAAISRYRFASGVVEFLVCTQCGCMPAALSEIEGQCYAVINANCLSNPLKGDAQIVDFASESPQASEQRRQRNWIGHVAIRYGAKEHG